jgi:hypothetical protein
MSSEFGSFINLIEHTPVANRVKEACIELYGDDLGSYEAAVEAFAEVEKEMRPIFFLWVRRDHAACHIDVIRPIGETYDIKARKAR